MTHTNNELSKEQQHGKLMKKNADGTLPLAGKDELEFGPMYITQKYDLIRSLQNVYRCSGIPLIKPYDCASHCYHTGLLFETVADQEELYNIVSQATEWVYRHDIVEAVTGDLPYPVKNHSKGTAAAWETIEAAIAHSFGISHYMDHEARLVFQDREWELFRACDLYELALFCYEDNMRGNTHPVFLQVLHNAITGIPSYGFETLNRGAKAIEERVRWT